MKKILITGGYGMLAHDLIPLLADYEVLVTDRDECDITDEHAVNNLLSEISPDIVINCAAYTQVDDAEDMGSELNYAVNTVGVGILAKVCAAHGADFLTISTDYVFDGQSQKGYLPTDDTAPINAYGKAKLAGEHEAFKYLGSAVVIRTSRLYGGGKEYKNFFNTMLSLSEKYPVLKVVDDQVGLPTYTVHVAEYILHIAQHIERYRGHIVHACNSGTPTSRCGFTQEIMKVTSRDVEITPCGSDQYPSKAKRPAWSALLSDDDTYTMPDRKTGVTAYAKIVS